MVSVVPRDVLAAKAWPTSKQTTSSILSRPSINDVHECLRIGYLGKPWLATTNVWLNETRWDATGISIDVHATLIQ